MATTYRVRYKNHATPQEQHSAGDRYYLDSDAGKKFSGTADITPGSTGTLTTAQTVDSTPATGDIIAANKDFVYIKNTGSTDILISLDDSGLAGGGSSNGNYLIVLSEGEAFASEISTSANIFAKTASGTSTIEYYVTT